MISLNAMVLPSMFGEVKDAFGVSYTEVALALTAFNVIWALLQTPAGFLIDRVGQRSLQTAGLLLGGVSIVGMIQPGRDMLVHAVTPAGSFGKVFGLVCTGLNIGGMVAPLNFGWLIDHGQPQAIYAIVIAFILLALVTAITRTKPQGTPAWIR